MSHFYFKKCFHCFSYWYTQHVLLQFMLIGFFGFSCIYIYMYVCIHTCSIWRFLIDILIFHFGALPCSYFHFNTLGIISNKLREKNYWSSFQHIFTGHHLKKSLGIISFFYWASFQHLFGGFGRVSIPLTLAAGFHKRVPPAHTLGKPTCKKTLGKPTC